MAELSNPADPDRLSRRALQFRALIAAREFQDLPKSDVDLLETQTEPWVEPPANTVRWFFEKRIAWLVAAVVGGLLIAGALWAFAGMPSASLEPGEMPLQNPYLASEPAQEGQPAQSSSPGDGASPGIAPDTAQITEPAIDQGGSVPPPPPPPLRVHVAGAVVNPGVVEVPADSRIGDAVAAAGGVTSEADLSRINLAAWVLDGARVYVLATTEEEAPEVVDPPGSYSSANPPSLNGSNGTNGTSGPNGGEGANAGEGASGGGANAGISSNLVNLNTADSSQLQVLSGIGPAMAQRIIDHREQFGPFTSLADLDAVSGIGPALLSKLEGSVTW